MLNTDRHNPAIQDKDKMTKEQFIRNNRETWDGKDPPRELLEQIFDSIVNNEIIIKAKGDPDKKGWVKGIKAGPNYEKGRVWVCLIANELRWYKSPTLGKGDVPVLGKVILDYVMIKGYGEDFAISLMVPKPMDFSVFYPSSHPLQPKEETMKTLQIIITCENEQQTQHWLEAITANITFNTLPDINPAIDLKKPKAPKGSKVKAKRN